MATSRSLLNPGPFRAPWLTGAMTDKDHCPECGGYLYVHIPHDGGPEPPQTYCGRCGWWRVLEVED
jgi:ribosomal protein S27AE